MFGWIPIIGPIIDGIVSIWKGHQDLEAIKYKTDGSVDIEGVRASTSIISATKDDIGVRFARDLLMYPTIVWVDLIVWDKIMAIHYPDLVYGVALLPEAIAYMPFAVVTFLLGNVGLNIWKRR